MVPLIITLLLIMIWKIRYFIAIQQCRWIIPIHLHNFSIYSFVFVLTLLIVPTKLGDFGNQTLLTDPTKLGETPLNFGDPKKDLLACVNTQTKRSFSHIRNWIKHIIPYVIAERIFIVFFSIKSLKNAHFTRL